MWLSLLLLALLADQSNSGTPLYFGFVEMTQTQSQIYTILGQAINSGRAPIVFLKSNTSANYRSNNWMDPCYERFHTYGDTMVIFWEINGDMYCETYKTAIGTKSTPTYAQKYLYRAERAGTRCTAK